MFWPALAPSAAKHGKTPERPALGVSVMLFSWVPFNVAIAVGVKLGEAPTMTVATIPARLPEAVGGLDSKALIEPVALAVKKV